MARSRANASAPSWKPQQVCIVTHDFPEWGPRVEVATSMLALAETFAEGGHDVTLVWVQDTAVPDAEFDRTREALKVPLGIRLEKLTSSPQLLPGLDEPEKRSVAVLHYLKAGRFDAVYFSLEGGLAYYTLLAKETGVYEDRPLLHVVAHCPIEHIAETERHFLRQWAQLAIAHMEKESVRLADHLSCSSAGLVTWMKEKGWTLPKNTAVRVPAIPQEWMVEEDRTVEDNAPPAVRELVLLSRPDLRYGMLLFCDALDELCKAGVTVDRVTVFGPYGHMLGEHSGGYLLRRARKWPFALSLHPRTSKREVIEYLRRLGAVGVIPWTASATAPWLIACACHDIPAVATATGAQIQIDKRLLGRQLLTRVDAKDMAEKMASALSFASRPSGEAPTAGGGLFLNDSLKAAWEKTLSSKARRAPSASRPTPPQKPLVSIIIAHRDRPRYLAHAIASVEQQTYERIEVVLVDDGSVKPETKAYIDRLELSFAKRGWQILRCENRYLGAARNAGTKVARGDFVIWLDDDNALFPHAVETYLKAIEMSGSAVCTALHCSFSDAVPGVAEDKGVIHYIALGNSLDLGLVGNPFGDANAIIRKSVFDRVGYMNETYGLSTSDWEFFARVALAGLKLTLIPEPLYWYRTSVNGMARNSHWYDNRLPILEAYRKAEYKGLDLVYKLAMAQFVWEEEACSLRENLRRSPSEYRHFKLCKMEPNHADTLEYLAEIASAEGRTETAIELLARLETKKFGVRAIQRLTTPLGAERSLRQVATGLNIRRGLSAEDLMLCEARSSAAQPPEAMIYLEPPGNLFLAARPGEIIAALCPAACPGSTIGVSAVISLTEDANPGSAFLLMVLPFHDDPVVAAESAGSDPSPGCSGWQVIEQRGEDVLLQAFLTLPSDEPANLVLCLRGAAGDLANSTGMFKSIEVFTALSDRARQRPRLGRPTANRGSRVLSRAEIGTAKLLTAHKGPLPMILFDPGQGGIFLRPSETGPIVAAMVKQFQPYARSVLARVEIAHDEAGPFEFALALVQPGVKIGWDAHGPSARVAFSGWVKVSRTRTLHDVLVRVPQTTAAPLNIHFAIRLPKGVPGAPSNAFWRTFIIQWDE